MIFKAKLEKDLKIFAAKLLNELGNHKIILFYGEMGAGKTTLIKYLCKELGVIDETSSPTYAIVNEYLTKDEEPVYHFDFYRIEQESEVMDLGYEDYFYSGNYCFIEWPEKISGLIPEGTVNIAIQIDKENNKKRKC